MTNLSDLQREAASKIIARFPQVASVEFRGDITLTVQAENLVEVMTFAKNSCGFDMLTSVASVDNMGREPRFETNYTITQAETGANLLVRCPVGGSSPAVPSLVGVWRSANWLEREQYDLMGIEFVGHPDLRRIMMWDGYPYHPLRKEFPMVGKESEQAGMAFTEVAPMEGGPFTTRPGVLTAGEREPGPRS